MRDPGDRAPGAWPRDRPIRWRGVAGNLRWFVAGTAALIVQLALVVPVLVASGSPGGQTFGGMARIVLALVWGGMTLFAAWSWVLGRWRVVIAPVVTVAAIALVLAA